MGMLGDSHGGKLVGWVDFVLDRMVGTLGLDRTLVQGEAGKTGATKGTRGSLWRLACSFHVVTRRG